MAQIANSTSFNRYPEIFSAAAIVLSGKPEARILSFGCSFGHEMASLRLYFPNARILGCDVSEDALAAASKRDVGPVFRSSARNIRDAGPFDAIFAMSVLCLNPPPTNLAEAFPFSEFEEHLSCLDSALADGGIICLSNANYRFTDSTVASGYRSVVSDAITSTGFVPLLSSSGKPIDGPDEAAVCIFQKTAGPTLRVDIPPIAPSRAPPEWAPIRKSGAA